MTNYLHDKVKQGVCIVNTFLAMQLKFVFFIHTKALINRTYRRE
jgi:hypothetical protein